MLAYLLEQSADAIRPAPSPFTPAEEEALTAAFQASTDPDAPQDGPGGAKPPQTLPSWLAEVYRRYGPRAAIARVACALATINPQDEDVPLRQIVRATRVPESEIKNALARLLDDSFIAMRPTVRIGARRIKLLR